MHKRANSCSEIVIVPEVTKPVAIRSVTAAHIGQLVVVRGIVTRISQLRPSLLVATYTCDACGCEVFQQVTSRTFMPLAECQSRICKERASGRGRLYLQTRGSKFVKFQELKLQESADQVPIGHIPRSLTVHLYGENTRTCSPGDSVTVSGVFLPTPFVGRKGMRAGLITDTFLEAMHVEQHKKKYSDFVITEAMAEKIEELKHDREVFSSLATSIAPEIFGMNDVKKCLLLALVGGVTKQLEDGMRIRGDINVCLVGDPGVAKSQLLKQVASIAPRGVYTTGKGSSGVGLTAAVLRDSLTRELVLEGGALVMADLGVCCIDEFDKMEDADRTAIHEVMEQQTVSIAKAGINTTLNARTSVIAAANPIFGRYNRQRTPAENVGLAAALLSRFDILFLLLDSPNTENDLSLAHHVTYVHMHSAPPPLLTKTVDAAFIRAYISQARKYQPSVPASLANHIIEEYVKMRTHDYENPDEAHSYTSARTLLSILRLSQALARLRMSETVHEEDITEAIRLMRASSASVRAEETEEIGTHTRDPKASIYAIIRDNAKSRLSLSLPGPQYIPVADILPQILAKGFTQKNLDDTLADYEALGVWQISTDRSRIRFLS
eukprot:TRINITY_DN5225_c0_g1_i1.p1 TRINITY_DN5225_c0_g1~~TRINITY_DN5225_c0_g1_i1.p1  ORF type:complete len:609 (-),score=162.88 TRINITY_DN5225_c0_g1_i1:32-1858(-)